MTATTTEKTLSTGNGALVALVLAFDDSELKRLRKPTNSDFARMLGRRRRNAMKLVDDLKAGNISLDEFERYFDDGLKRTHINAAVMGRQRAGSLDDEDETDEIFGIARAGQDLPYLRRMIRDLRDGRYGPIRDLNDVAVKRRALMYLDKARATANERFAWESGTEALFDWVTMQDERTCSTCPTKAKNGPYDVRQLGAIGYPAGGQDQCRTNCRCLIRRQDGVPGFGFVPLVTPAAAPARQLVGV